MRKTARRFEMYADPNTCPNCAAPATTILGARRYCDRCYEFLTRPTPKEPTP